MEPSKDKNPQQQGDYRGSKVLGAWKKYALKMRPMGNFGWRDVPKGTGMQFDFYVMINFLT